MSRSESFGGGGDQPLGREAARRGPGTTSQAGAMPRRRYRGAGDSAGHLQILTYSRLQADLLYGWGFATDRAGGAP
jgi:hypothetical protein